MIRLSRLPWGLAAALAAAWLLPVPVLASPSVNVALKAAFPSPPYLVELLETAAPENATCYFALLDRIAQGHFTSAKTDKALYEKFVETLKQDGHMDAEALSTFKLALSMRTAAPRIEAHYQYYATAVESSVTPPAGEGEGDGESEDSSCEHWFLYNGAQYCAPSLETVTGPVKKNSQERTLPFDRTLGSGQSQNHLILYADITSPTFKAYHDLAAGMAKSGEASYRLRYKRSPAHPHEALSVNGYGVELALKRTDYIVIDDRETGDAKAAPAEKEEEAQKKIAAREVVLNTEEEVADIKPLEKSELLSVGLKAASFIMQSETPFDTLLRLTQDFPKHATSLGAHNVSSDFLAEHEERVGQVPPGVNVLWMNGVQLIDRQIQPFGLVDLLRRERKLINGVLDLGLTGREAVSLLGHSEIALAKAGQDEPRRFDWRDEAEEGKVIIWLNDIEKDKRYESWSTSPFAILQAMGSLPKVRKDVFNLVFPLDFSNLEDLSIVLDQLLTFMKRLVPIRFGLVPLTPTPEAAEQAKVVYHILENYGLKAMSTYLQDNLDTKKATKASEGIFKKAIKDAVLRPEATALPFAEILTSEYHETQIQHANHWVERLHADGPVPSVFYDGFAFPRDENWLKVMNQRVSFDLQLMQQAVYYGLVTEDMWLAGHFLEHAIARRNTLIYPEDAQNITMLNINKIYTEHQDLFGKIPVIEADEQSSRDDWAVLTVIADFDRPEGWKLLFNALEFRRENHGVRLDIVHNPVDSSSRAASVMNGHLRAAQNKLIDAADLTELEATIVQTDVVDSDPDSSPTDNDGYDAALAGFLSSAKILPGDSMLVLNGRVIGPVVSANSFKKEDFSQFLDAERASRILPVYRAVDDLGLGEKVSGPLAAAKLSSVTALSGISDLPQGVFESAPSTRTTIYKDWNTTHSSFEVGDASTATIHLVAVLNPASELGQKWAPILKVLSDLDGVHLRVFLNPKDGLSELPIKRFYRYVLDSAPSFDSDGKLRSLSATFQGVPSDTLLIAGMDVPPAWLVSSKVSVDDLDNIRIKDIRARRNTENIEAVYELEHILIEGHSRELPSGSAPRGVQLVLATEQDAHFADTIIMANLGFFQFKANPGVYSIRLEAGRSSDIFAIQSVGPAGWAPVPGDETTEIALMDFQGSTLYPRLVRQPGMEDEDVLDMTSGSNSAGAGADSLASSAMDLVSRGLRFAEGILGGSSSSSKSLEPASSSSSSSPSASDLEHAEINIFSVASGHLYERMLNIMMVSVMRHTNHTVKFWFIEQFLSPSFKDFIPAMAAEYGFRYEMVTYKWPHWLRGQKEKQREIWGYKILFLDVLFPLSLDKVIFVDADQIVRADMHDLVRLDLQGAPYGFTPMCDSRTEMEGFRFWKTGYWAGYLKGRPYHISALYVVDLRRFRALAAGDRLRQQYHALSADPASLSNLDQDLPNHMQFNIPIHSLPQDWLWCETWCSDDALTTARTIDLCNNPLTKEPKLDRARRQVPEWTVYDDEIAALDRRRRREAGKGEGEGEGDGEGEGEGAVHVKDEL